MVSEFELALRELRQEDKPLARRALINLSGPTRAEIEAFFVAWKGFSAERKREIIARMVELAEENFEIDYVALFRGCLRDDEPVVRRYAIEGLWEDERADLVEPLLKLLASDPDASVRAAAAMSLGRFVYLAECDELDAQRGARIREALERAINSRTEEMEVVRRAIESIAFINDDRARRIIDRAYDHDDERMRQSAVFAMGRSADVVWADTVMAELYATSPAMRYEAARACGELQLRRAVPQLVRLVQDSDREVQGMAVWALGQVGGKRARMVLDHLAEGDDEVLASAALEALDEMEFATRPMDLMVHEVDAEDEEEELNDEGEWADDFINVD
jgi:HEAT repeat protein